MILISHRGNLEGRVPNMENSPTYIQKALDCGFDVEIDVWYKDNKWYLGHDEPLYDTDIDYLRNKKFWCHAKNIEALGEMLKEDIHCFWHQEDDVTLTSNGYMWTYPGQKLVSKSICVLPEKNNDIPKKIYGICSDFIINYRRVNNE